MELLAQILTSKGVEVRSDTESGEDSVCAAGATAPTKTRRAYRKRWPSVDISTVEEGEIVEASDGRYWTVVNSRTRGGSSRLQWKLWRPETDVDGADTDSSLDVAIELVQPVTESVPMLAVTSPERMAFPVPYPMNSPPSWLLPTLEEKVGDNASPFGVHWSSPLETSATRWQNPGISNFLGRA